MNYEYILNATNKRKYHAYGWKLLLKKKKTQIKDFLKRKGKENIMERI